jgi:hypothetical protein
MEKDGPLRRIRPYVIPLARENTSRYDPPRFSHAGYGQEMPNMRLPRRANRLFSGALIATMTFCATSCGTLLHPERRGQPPGGRLDPSIVLLDAAGLLLFLVPGLIAFAVDFSTGAIYLPPDYNWAPSAAAGTSTKEIRAGKLVKVELAKEELTRVKIEQTISEKTGRIVDLEPGQYRASRLSGLERFDEQAQRLQRQPSGEAPTAIDFR